MDTGDWKEALDKVNAGGVDRDSWSGESEMDSEEESKALIKLTECVRQLAKVVDKLEQHQEDHRERYAAELAENAVTRSKVSRLENLVYGIIGAIGLEAVAIGFQIVSNQLNK